MHIPIRLNRKLHAGLISQHNQHCRHCITTNSDSSEQTCSQDCSPKAQAVAICFWSNAWFLTCYSLKARVACRAGNTHAYKGMSSSRNPGTWKWLHKMPWKLFKFFELRRATHEQRDKEPSSPTKSSRPKKTSTLDSCKSTEPRGHTTPMLQQLVMFKLVYIKNFTLHIPTKTNSRRPKLQDG